MNVLITSISAKVPMIRAVRKAVAGFDTHACLYGADMNPKAVGRYFVDAFWTMPALKALSPEAFIAYCHEQKISHVIPTRDAELLYFSEYRQQFHDSGIAVMVSDAAAVARMVDKLTFFRYGASHGFPVIPTALSPEELQASAYVVKERRGSGSERLHLNVTAEQATHFAASMDEPLFQPYISGREYSVDLYVDSRYRAHGVIARERLVVRNGESQVTRTVDDPIIERLAACMAESFGLFGHVMFQVVKNEEGFHVVECNPRFGGASTLSIAAGLDSFYWFLLESSGQSLERVPFKKNARPLTLVRHPQDLIL